MSWWKKKKQLLVREKAKIDEAYPNNDFAFEIRDSKLWISGTLLGFFQFECEYPDSYPFAPPNIYPKDRSPKWVPRHQYKPSGRFCLDIREKTWSSRLTAADIIKSLEVLLVAEGVRKIRKEEKLIVYEEDEPTRVDEIFSKKICILPSDIKFPDNATFGTFKFICNMKQTTCRAIITDVFCQEKHFDSKIAKKIWGDPFKLKLKGLWIRIKEGKIKKLIFFSDYDKLENFLRSENIIPKDKNIADFLGDKSSINLLVFDDKCPNVFFFILCDKDKNKVNTCVTYQFNLDKLMERIPSKEGYEFLKDKKVTIIGCGSGGSKDAEYFVKAGVGKLVLIDDDNLDTENIIRHACQLDDLSIEKVYAVSDKLLKINPRCHIDTYVKHLDIIDPKTDELIHDSDLIIVATAANEELFNEYAFSHGIPCIYSKVYPYGFGGEVLRIIPGITPCYECSHYFKEVIIQENRPDAKFPEFGAVSYDITSEGRQIPIPALAVDSDFISLITVKMGIELLTATDKEVFKKIPNIRLWGNKKEWIFKHEYECLSIEPKSVVSLKNCIVCNGENVIAEELEKTASQIQEEYEKIISGIKKD